MSGRTPTRFAQQMIENLAYSLLGCLLSFLASTAALPFVKRVALAVRAMDYPGGRRQQAEAIPRLGGVAVALGFFAAQALIILIRWGIWRSQNTQAQLFAIPIAFLLIFLCGFLEDTVGTAMVTRLSTQAVSAFLVVKVGWSFGAINLPLVGNLELGFLTDLISVLWIVGVTNAVNFLDGLDGLAGGVVAIIASSLLVFSIWRHDFVTAIIMATMVGACLGFLRKNWAPAQIYLGDAGSLTLGFILAVVSLRSSIKAPAAVAILVPILALGLPVIDTLLVMLFRFTKRSGKLSLAKRARRMFLADRNHVHHLLLGLSTNRKQIVIGLYSVAVAFCAMALMAATTKTVAPGLLLVALEVVVVFSIRRFGMRAWALKLSIEQRQEAKELLLATVNEHPANPGLTIHSQLYKTDLTKNA